MLIGANNSIFGGNSSPYLYYWECPQTPGIWTPGSVLASWLTYTRASSQDSVQIGTSQVFTGAGSADYDKCPIGRVDDSHNFGLAFEQNYTNIPNSRTRIGWAKSAPSTQSNVIGPDGNALAWRYQCPGVTDYAGFVSVTGSSGDICLSSFVKTETSGKNRLATYKNASPYNNIVPCTNSDLTALWRRQFSVANTTETGHAFATINAATAGFPAVTNNDQSEDFLVRSYTKYPLEWHAGTRAAPFFRMASGLTPFGTDGKLRLEIIGRVRCSFAGANYPAYSARLFGLDTANNNIFVTASTGVIGGFIGSSTAITFSNAFTPSLYDYVKIYLEVGGISHRLAHQINSGAVSSATNTTARTWSPSFSIVDLLNLVTGTTCLPITLEKIALYKPDFKPLWVP